jgi:intraflagellar transport protein 88
MGDADRMRTSFKKLVSIPIEDPVGDSADIVGADSDLSDDDDEETNHSDLQRRRYFEPGTLEKELESRRMRAVEYITTAARLIAPVLFKDSWIEGYEWAVKTLEKSQHTKIGSELTIAKSLQYLKEKRFKEAIDVLKGFEKKEKDLMARAANNLSFLYFLEGDVEQADKYANVAVRSVVFEQ